MTSPVWSPGRFWLLGAGNRPASPLHFLAPSHSGICAVRVTVPPLVSSLTAALFGFWPYGLAIAALPLVSRPWTGLCWSHLLSLSSVGSVRGSTAPVGWLRGVFSCFANCPTSSVLKRCSFGISASVLRQIFAMGTPFRVESVSVLDRNEVSSSTFLVFGWSLRDGVTLSGQGCPRSQSERRLFAHLP